MADRRSDPDEEDRRRRPARESGAAFSLYLALAVFLWWHVWSSHPTSASACACGDPGLVTWFLAWPAYAISHGLNPFFSSFMYHPFGVNLLSNASSPLFGTLLAPVTWLFGPIATFNVALTIAPPLTGLTMFWLVRRWTSWTPAAFVSGLFYGFSPFVVTSVANGHLMTASLMFLPLFALSLHQLLLVQDRPAVRTGIGLGVLTFLQFFASTEVLVITVVCAACGLVLLVAYGAVVARDELRRRAHHALVGLAVAGVVAGATLAYPVWFALAGPAHISGQIWAGLSLSAAGTTVRGLLGLTPHTVAAQNLAVTAGYVGPQLPDPSTIGIGALAVIGLGLLAFRRSRALWILGAVGLVSALLAFGDVTTAWTPWRLADRSSLLRNLIPGRFLSVTLLCASAMVGIVIDEARRSLRRGIASRRGTHAAAVVAGVGALLVGVAALAPIVVAEAPVVPLTLTRVRTPPWFRKQATDLSAGQVVEYFPRPGPGAGSRILVWQAMDGMSFATTEGGGPESSHLPAVPYSYGGYESPPAPPTPATVAAMSAALRQFKVTLEVFVPTALQHPPTPYAVNLTGILTEALGQPPVVQSGALVWKGGGTTPLDLPPAVFTACSTFGPTMTDDLLAEADCLVAPSHALVRPPPHALRDDRCRRTITGHIRCRRDAPAPSGT
ncbi:MAG TPA: hypothetical protein VMB82_11670 [Acidimicrobiales bacterium]|nr:hypothetical protein [Acidimicrobiales bacterium]